jgi:ubiquinone/menaquinone biosynthesis C-methylase UbiE
LNKSVAKAVIPKPIRRVLRRLQFLMLDFNDAAERRKTMVPPRSMWFVGNGDFRTIGMEFQNYFREYGGLQPDHRVLDVGCGIGRMAVPLTDYLSEHGAYEGFDIVKKGIEWCQANISPRYPNFHFRHSDIWNSLYNPTGIYQASTYRFPYEDASFDFVFLTSVFTHMLPGDLEQYLREIVRVLKPRRKCLATFFLINDESQTMIQRKQSTQNFVHEINGCFITNTACPEEAVAYPETYVRELFSRFGLSTRDEIYYGSWCGRSNFLSYQDIVLGVKE